MCAAVCAAPRPRGIGEDIFLPKLSPHVFDFRSMVEKTCFHHRASRRRQKQRTYTSMHTIYGIYTVYIYHICILYISHPLKLEDQETSPKVSKQWYQQVKNRWKPENIP